jgi:hypothetical protein
MIGSFAFLFVIFVFFTVNSLLFGSSLRLGVPLLRRGACFA